MVTVWWVCPRSTAHCSLAWCVHSLVSHTGSTHGAWSKHIDEPGQVYSMPSSQYVLHACQWQVMPSDWTLSRRAGQG